MCYFVALEQTIEDGRIVHTNPAPIDTVSSTTQPHT